jgi:hypothetical protein
MEYKFFYMPAPNSSNPRKEGDLELNAGLQSAYFHNSERRATICIKRVVWMIL